MSDIIQKLKEEIIKRDTILNDLGILYEDIEDLYSDVMVKASRYDWLRERLAVEDLPQEHPSWSVATEHESVKIDKEIDKRIKEQTK